MVAERGDGEPTETVILAHQQGFLPDGRATIERLYYASERTGATTPPIVHTFTHSHIHTFTHPHDDTITHSHLPTFTHPHTHTFTH